MKILIFEISKIQVKMRKFKKFPSLFKKFGMLNILLNLYHQY